MRQSVLVMYVPAIHASYLKFFEKFDEIKDLYILGEDIIADFPILQREIRAIKPEDAKKLLKSYFSSINILDKKNIGELNGRQIIMTDEQISDDIRKKYFKGQKVKQVKGFFLRFDEKYVQDRYGASDYATKVSEDEFVRNIMKQAVDWAEKSPNWWRRVGALLLNDNKVLLGAYNQNMPNDHSQWVIGDPRTYMAYGTDTHLRNVIHAEQGLIAEAARLGIKTDGLDLFATTYPCPDCMQNVAVAGIKRVYFKTGFAQVQSSDIFKTYNIEVIKVV